MPHVLQWRQRVRRSLGSDKRLCLCMPAKISSGALSCRVLPLQTPPLIRYFSLPIVYCSGVDNWWINRHLGKWQPTTSSEAHHGTGWRSRLTDRRPGHSLYTPNRPIQTLRPSLRPSSQLPQCPHPYNHPQPMNRISPTSFPPRSNPVQPISTVSLYGSTTYHLGCGHTAGPFVTMAALPAPRWPV